MAQVRILYTDGTRDEIDVASEESVTASVVDGKVVVIADMPGCDEADVVADPPAEDVVTVVTSPWSESDREIEMEETPIWPPPD